MCDASEKPKINLSVVDSCFFSLSETSISHPWLPLFFISYLRLPCGRAANKEAEMELSEETSVKNTYIRSSSGKTFQQPREPDYLFSINLIFYEVTSFQQIKWKMKDGRPGVNSRAQFRIKGGTEYNEMKNDLKEILCWTNSTENYSQERSPFNNNKKPSSILTVLFSIYYISVSSELTRNFFWWLLFLEMFTLKFQLFFSLFFPFD